MKWMGGCNSHSQAIEKKVLALGLVDGEKLKSGDELEERERTLASIDRGRGPLICTRQLILKKCTHELMAHEKNSCGKIALPVGGIHAAAGLGRTATHKN